MKILFLKKLNQQIKIPVIRKRKYCWHNFMELIGIDGNIANY